MHLATEKNMSVNVPFHFQNGVLPFLSVHVIITSCFWQFTSCVVEIISSYVCFWNRVQVPKRSSSRTVQAKGIYPGAKVTRGPDWASKYKDQDGKICKRNLKHSGGGKGRAKGSGRPRQQFAGAAIDGQTFGVLALALQRVLLSLYLFLSFSLIQEKKKL